MQIKPAIKESQEKKLVGMKILMSIAQDKTLELWKSFMPRRKEIGNILNTELISMEVYDTALLFEDFSPETIFQKWAAVEVAEYSKIPEGMEAFTLPSGLYAVFIHKGFEKTIDSIFGTWLPASDYLLDQRPHFAVMGDKYKNGDPNSEEELWIPVKSKK